MTEKNMIPEPEILDSEECWKLLRQTGIGRLGVVLDGRPEIFPVNFKVEDDSSVVFQTGSGTKTEAMDITPTVVLEADAVSAEFGIAWSVVVKGNATRMDANEPALALFPWQGVDKEELFRIVPESVTGRRFTVTEHMKWRSSLDEASRAGLE